jgi:ABC-type sulfate transport system permease component
MKKKRRTLMLLLVLLVLLLLLCLPVLYLSSLLNKDFEVGDVKDCVQPDNL